MLITRTPLRISLTGGGSDLPSYYQNNKYGAVCSLAINKYVYVVAKDLPAEFPYNYKLAYSQTELRQTVDGITHPILKEVIKDAKIKRLDFASMADIPGGTGMGSSSAFTVGAAHVCSLLQTQTIPTKQQLAAKACEIEINALKGALGKQDQYAAAYGGINYIRFNSDESVDVRPIVLDPVRENLFLSHLRLYFLGAEPRRADSILKEQRTSGALLDEIRHQAAVCTDILTHGMVEELGSLLNRAWGLKKRLSPKISTPSIDAAYELVIRQGAYGGKLLGAGGSGYLLVCCPPDLYLNTNLKRVEFRPDYQGSTAFYI